jgi:hypothetical protein
MKITLAAVLSLATLFALTCRDVVNGFESETTSTLRKSDLDAPAAFETSLLHHHLSESESDALPAVLEGGGEDLLAPEADAYYTDEGGNPLSPYRRKLMMGGMSGSRMGDRRGSGSYSRNGYVMRMMAGYYDGKRGYRGMYGKGKGHYYDHKGKGKGKWTAKGKGKGGYKPTPPRPTPQRPTPRPPTPPPQPPVIIQATNCTLKNATRVTCDFARLAVNVTLDDPDQLAILMEDCGISSVTAIKNMQARDVNVRDDPSTTQGNLVFLKGPPVNGGIGNGGCLTFQFMRGPNRVGVDLINMEVTALDDVVSVQVSRDDFLSLHRFFKVTNRR